MTSATVYCAAPADDVRALVGVLADQVDDENDGIAEYQSVLELEGRDEADAREIAEEYAAIISAAGIDVALSLDRAPVPYVA